MILGMMKMIECRHRMFGDWQAIGVQYFFVIAVFEEMNDARFFGDRLDFGIVIFLICECKRVRRSMLQIGPCTLGEHLNGIVFTFPVLG